MPPAKPDELQASHGFLKCTKKLPGGISTLALGLRPERRFAPLARGLQRNYMLFWNLEFFQGASALTIFNEIP